MNNMKIQSCFRHVWVLAFLLGMGQIGAWGQAIGVEVVVDTAFYGPNTPTPEDTFDPDEAGGYVGYLVYVNFTNPTDVLSAIFRTSMSTRKAVQWVLMPPVVAGTPLTIRWS